MMSASERLAGSVLRRTHSTASDTHALLCLQRARTSPCIQKLNKPVCLLYGHLREFAVLVKYVEEVTLSDFFGG